MQIHGTIKVINPEQQVSASFRKRELVVTTDEQYPQQILIEFTQDKCDLLNNFSIGQSVKVSINLRGRIWTNPQGDDKYFNSIQGWKIEADSQENQNQNQSQSAVDNYENRSNSVPMGNPQEAFGSTNDDQDDLPF